MKDHNRQLADEALDHVIVACTEILEKVEQRQAVAPDGSDRAKRLVVHVERAVMNWLAEAV